MDEDSSMDQMRAMAELVNSAISSANINSTASGLQFDEPSETLPNGEVPEYYHETAVVDRHKLTAVEGQLHPLVWICRICGETAANSGVFSEVDCDG